ncbi:MAG: hypothetical protein CMF31_02885 [Kordiimonas sp.]|nr:hypothetical protein [Kordiimonas sp.]|tara:strand:- start:3065 stop:3538 length:474 start_codon:yes stop_codon:yes gene_type:complete
MFKKVAVILSTCIFLTACEDMGEKEGLGTLLGAIGGAVIGAEIGGDGTSRDIAVAAGTIMGASLGRSIGKSLDKADRLEMERAQQAALESSPSGQTSTWHNPDSGNGGTFTPEPAVANDDGQYCREYTQTITVGGETQQGYGRACRQPDGTWKIANN